MPPTLITGNDNSNTLNGGASDDVIYGFDPDGPQSLVSTISATRVASGIAGVPLFAAAPPGDLNRLFIVTKDGFVRILDLERGQLLPTPFLDVSAEVDTAGERGLLGLAFDPDFATNGLFYVNLINTPASDTEIRRYSVSALNPNQADPASMSRVITIDQTAFSNHKAGWLGFGPDGYLYAALGDGGPSNDLNNNAQNVGLLLGKMLRLDVDNDAFPADTSRNYAIPADNPFVTTSPADEIYALGLRNPWRDSFDRALGTFFIADVGQGEWEEIDIGAAGANYGWRIYEGTEQRTTETPSAGTLTFPIHSYDRTIGQSITGGYVYRGESEGLHGQYFFADFSAAKLFTLRFDGAAWEAMDRTSQVVANAGSVSDPTSFGEDGRGNLYVVDLDGEVFRLTPLVASADQADVLNGGAGEDMLFGGSGNDTLIGGPGADTLIGGPGIDVASYASSSAAIAVNLRTGNGRGGDAHFDVLTGMETVVGSRFDDTIHGAGGPNSLFGEDGDDTLFGAGGDDYLTGGEGGDVLNGGPGLDFARYDRAAGVSVDLAGTVDNTGEAMDDTFSFIEGLVGSGLSDLLFGDAGPNNLQGRGGDDFLFGRVGVDTLQGGDGHDTLNGDENNDSLYGQVGSDTLNGDAGNDYLTGGADGDVLDGGPGADFARYDDSAGVTVDLMGLVSNMGDAAGDSFFGIESVVGSALGADFIFGDEGANELQGRGGDDFLDGRTGADMLKGGAGADRLTGGSGNDTLNGDENNDYLTGGADGDVLDGGPGHDFARYDTSAGVTVDLMGLVPNMGEAAGDSFIGIESVVGSALGPDSIFGDEGANELQGRGGDDFLDGRAGADTLKGGAGADSLTGGGQNDTFIFVRTEAHGDSLVDFDGMGAAVGDRLIFSGYGTLAMGASFTMEPADPFHWTIRSSDGFVHETLTIANAATFHPTDFIFV